ncbi:MAG TPA: hypothetical protein VG435_08315 [Acidimicrobiales bacterium]|nr:hypothetical protein [Acidimicrobiales bacterium]
MSSLWTPGGERPVGKTPDAPPAAAAGAEPSEEEMRQHMAELRDRLANTPADVVVANHAYGLFELAALHLSLERPQLAEAALAIDALGCLVDGLGDRLGEPAGELGTALAQLRLAFVQVQAAQAAPPAGDRPQTD